MRVAFVRTAKCLREGALVWAYASHSVWELRVTFCRYVLSAEISQYLLSIAFLTAGHQPQCSRPVGYLGSSMLSN